MDSKAKRRIIAEFDHDLCAVVVNRFGNAIVGQGPLTADGSFKYRCPKCLKWLRDQGAIFPQGKPNVQKSATSPTLEPLVEKFWIVWSPQGLTPPKRKHPTFKGAHAAAAIMAEKYPEKEFYVMSAKLVCKTDKPVVNTTYTSYRKYEIKIIKIYCVPLESGAADKC